MKQAREDQRKTLVAQQQRVEEEQAIGQDQSANISFIAQTQIKKRNFNAFYRIAAGTRRAKASMRCKTVYVNV